MTNHIEVGQKLWYYRSLFYRKNETIEPIEVEVVKVGRKWATLNRRYGRIDLETLFVDGGDYMSPGRCYLSREVHDAEEALQNAWGIFQSTVRETRQIPKDLTTADIKSAMKILKIGEN